MFSTETDTLFQSESQVKHAYTFWNMQTVVRKNAREDAQFQATY